MLVGSEKTQDIFGLKKKKSSIACSAAGKSASQVGLCQLWAPTFQGLDEHELTWAGGVYRSPGLPLSKDKGINEPNACLFINRWPPRESSFEKDIPNASVPSMCGKAHPPAASIWGNNFLIQGKDSHVFSNASINLRKLCALYLHQIFIEELPPLDKWKRRFFRNKDVIVFLRCFGFQMLLMHLP